MSWNDYVYAYLVNNTDPNNQKTATNVCEHAAIIGNNDGTVWASTPGFTFESYTLTIENDDGTTTKTNINEFANLLSAFNSPTGNCSNAGGIRIHNEKYFTVSKDNDRKVLYLKKSGGGACVAKSNLAFAIGTYSSKLKEKNYAGTETPQNPGDCNRACESLQEFLITNSL
jgi:hypothetical protein